jgi:hypothetical protein
MSFRNRTFRRGRVFYIGAALAVCGRKGKTDDGPLRVFLPYTGSVLGDTRS